MATEIVPADERKRNPSPAKATMTLLVSEGYAEVDGDSIILKLRHHTDVKADDATVNLKALSGITADMVTNYTKQGDPTAKVKAELERVMAKARALGIEV